MFLQIFHSLNADTNHLKHRKEGKKNVEEKYGRTTKWKLDLHYICKLSRILLLEILTRVGFKIFVQYGILHWGGSDGKISYISSENEMHFFLLLKETMLREH